MLRALSAFAFFAGLLPMGLCVVVWAVRRLCPAAETNPQLRPICPVAVVASGKH